MSLGYYYVFSLSNNVFFTQLYSKNSQRTDQEVREALGLNYLDLKPYNTSYHNGQFPKVFDGFRIWNNNNNNNDMNS